MGTKISRTLLLSSLLLLAAVPGCEDEAKKSGDTASEASKLGKRLDGEEIEKLFSDKTVKGHHERRGYDFRSYYAKDGTFRSHQSDKDGPRQAKWWVKGDDICVRWEDTPEDMCRSMYRDEGGTYRKVKDTPRGPIVVVTFESFADGNPEKL